MVRPMKCPYCGSTVNVSSHWKDTTCPNCKNVFEIGLEVFELSEEEQKKEQERALADIKKKEEEAALRKAETAKRLRQTLKLPEPDPHKHIKFEDEEQPKTPEVTDKKKRMIMIGVAAGVFVLILIVVIFLASMISKKAAIDATAVTTTEATTVAETETSSSEVINTTDNQMYDSGWNDGYSIDSNSEDGRFKIDLQDSDSGEQRDGNVRPDVVDETEAPKQDTVSDNTIQTPAPESTGSSNNSSVNGLDSSAVGPETPGTPGTTSSADDSSVINDMILNGVN